MPEKGEWVRVYQRGLRRVVRDPLLTGEVLRVLLCVMAYQGYGRGVVLQQATMAKELGLHPVTVCRALKRLCVQGVLMKQRTQTGVLRYCVHTDLIHKGKE